MNTGRSGIVACETRLARQPKILTDTVLAGFQQLI